MKKIFLSLAIAAISVASYKKADAQVSVQINVGGLFSAAISSAPIMSAPVVANSGYYYYDDINCYYDIANSQYIYPEDGVWYYSASIPMIFGDYDFRNARHTNMDRRAFMGRGINPVAFNRQPNGNRGYNNIGGNGRMNQDRFAQQNMARQPQMQNRDMQRMGNQPSMNGRGFNNPQEGNRQVQQNQRAVSMNNNNGREMRDSRHRGF